MTSRLLDGNLTTIISLIFQPLPPTYHLFIITDTQLSLAAFGTLHHMKPCSGLSNTSALLMTSPQVTLLPQRSLYWSSSQCCLLTRSTDHLWLPISVLCFSHISPTCRRRWLKTCRISSRVSFLGVDWVLALELLIFETVFQESGWSFSKLLVFVLTLMVIKIMQSIEVIIILMLTSFILRLTEWGVRSQDCSQVLREICK